MILQHHGDEVLFITQIDHARLSGDLARRWGNEAAPRSPLWDALITATDRHDDGWESHDAAPSIDEHGNIHDFLTAPMATRVAIYQAGVTAVADEPAPVRLLVSMHLTGLFRGRYEPDNPGFIEFLQGEDRELALGFVEAEEEAQATIRADVVTDLWPHYRLLQLFDRLSLAFCMQPLDRLTRATIEYVPLAGGDSSMDVWSEAGALVLDPFPYPEPFEVELPLIRLKEPTWPSAEALAEAISGAARETQIFKVVPPA
jgi:hypothetical protein